VTVDSCRSRSYDSQAIQPVGWISLYDVIRRTGTYFLNVYRLLVSFEELVAVVPLSRGGPEQQIVLTALGGTKLFSELMAGNTVQEPLIPADRIHSNLEFVEHDATELGLEGTADRIRAIREYVAQHTTIDFVGDERLKHDVRVLRETLTSELERRWIFIPDLGNFRKYFNKSFGQEVDDAFPDAIRDTASAANGYIYDEPDACVFHCMRTAEYGLRGLARRIAPRLRAEKLEWGMIIKVLRKRIDDLHAPGKRRITPQREKRLEFYAEALDQCQYFKGIRNNAMHTHGHYESADALKALTHVEEFMRLLAKNGIKLIPKIF
jgi:hypothetical protein